MPWIQIKINSSGEHAETLSDALMDIGAVSVTFQAVSYTHLTLPTICSV